VCVCSAVQDTKFPTIKCPTLVLWGDQDHALGTELLAGMSPRYVADLTLKMVPGASHWVQCDAPDVVNQEMAAFLKRSEKTA
jgi:epoxide hydrolase 4